MAGVTLNVHDATWTQYRQLDVPEKRSGDYAWKQWCSTSVTITVFRPDGPGRGTDA